MQLSDKDSGRGKSALYLGVTSIGVLANITTILSFLLKSNENTKVTPRFIICLTAISLFAWISSGLIFIRISYTNKSTASTAGSSSPIAQSSKGVQVTGGDNMEVIQQGNKVGGNMAGRDIN